MKKILVALMLGLVSISHFTLQAQTIASDEVNSEGIRVVTGSLEVVRDFKDKAVFNVGLSALNNPSANVTMYSLAVKVTSMTPYELKKDMVLLIKTTSGEVITLKAASDYDASVRDVHNVNGYVYSDYSTIALYPITEDEILKIAQGVTKIRQEIVAGAFDKEYKKDKVAQVIIAEYKEIKKALQTPKSITDGF